MMPKTFSTPSVLQHAGDDFAAGDFRHDLVSFFGEYPVRAIGVPSVARR